MGAPGPHCGSIRAEKEEEKEKAGTLRLDRTLNLCSGHWTPPNALIQCLNVPHRLRQSFGTTCLGA